MLELRQRGHAWSRILPPVLLACAVLYGAVLRLDALFESFGPYERPVWLAAVQQPVEGLASRLTHVDWRWPRQSAVYSGDPGNYLLFAREMRHFYQAHVREPMFVAATRLSLKITNDADVGISLTSITFSLLTMIATYMVGAQIASPWIGLGAAVALGIDHSAVAWSVEGWRDEMFAFFVVLSAWAWIRMARVPSYGHAVLAGIVSAAACLTRITALTFLAPLCVWFMVGRRADAPARVRALAISVFVTIVLVAPYLINCALETGDPLYAINYHTQYYLDKEGAADTRPIGAMRYMRDKFSTHPVAAVDTALRGLTVHPFTIKWAGLDLWYPGLGLTLSWLALAGLFAWLWQPYGRLLLLVVFSSLIPYMLTWSIGGGGEWRFTFHVYPFYLLAAFWVLWWVTGWARELLRNGAAQLRPQLLHRQALYAALLLAVLSAGGLSWALFMPYFIARESLLAGEPAVIFAGEREAWLFSDGWSDPVARGNVIARSAEESLATVRMPLPESRNYHLRLRMDPLHHPDSSKQTVRVMVNRNLVGVFDLTFNPNRVGEYRALLPARLTREGMDELTFWSEPMTFRLWYVLITPG